MSGAAPRGGAAHASGDVPQPLPSGPRALRPRPAAARPLRSGSPVPARLLLRVIGVDASAGLFPALHRHLALLPGPEILFTLPLPAAGVLEQGHAGEVERAVAARVIAAVLHVEDDATALDVDRVPLVHGVDLAVLRHDGLDPGTDRLATRHRAIVVLEVGAVLGEEVGPGIPVLADGASAPVPAERGLQLVTIDLRHPSLPLSRMRCLSTPVGSTPAATGHTGRRRVAAGLLYLDEDESVEIPCVRLRP